MNRRPLHLALAGIFIAVICGLLMLAKSAFGADLQTTTGQVYKNATVLGSDPDGLRVTYDGGVVKVPFTELSARIQKQYGYDTAKVAELKRQEAAKIRADADLRRKILAEKERAAQEAIAADSARLSAEKQKADTKRSHDAEESVENDKLILAARAATEASRATGTESERKETNGVSSQQSGARNHDGGATVFGVFVSIYLIILFLAFYFLPACIGLKKRNRVAIFVANLFFGWTAIGWVLCLVWAFMRDSEMDIELTRRRAEIKRGDTAWRLPE